MTPTTQPPDKQPQPNPKVIATADRVIEKRTELLKKLADA